MMMKKTLMFLFSNYISLNMNFYQRGFDFLQYGELTFTTLSQSVLTETKEIQCSLKVIT